ncbi:hypothetical protein C8R44DRAFT_729394 [Mycena epipterygia]|nr:hypothetical protein C8R44DRAFT_729394 [Mycena epipterygia]
MHKRFAKSKAVASALAIKAAADRDAAVYDERTREEETRLRVAETPGLTAASENQSGATGMLCSTMSLIFRPVDLLLARRIQEEAKPLIAETPGLAAAPEIQVEADRDAAVDKEPNSEQTVYLLLQISQLHPVDKRSNLSLRIEIKERDAAVGESHTNTPSALDKRIFCARCWIIWQPVEKYQNPY